MAWKLSCNRVIACPSRKVKAELAPITIGQVDRYSFLVRLLPPLLHAGLSRRTNVAISLIDLGVRQFSSLFFSTERAENPSILPRTPYLTDNIPLRPASASGSCLVLERLGICVFEGQPGLPRL